MKKINDTYIVLAATATGVALLAFMFAGTKTQHQIQSNADHPIGRQAVWAALNKVHATSGVHPQPELFTRATSQSGGLPNSRSLPSGRAPIVALARPEPTEVAEAPRRQTDKSLLRVQEKLRQAMAAVDKARSDLRTAVAFQAQSASRG